MAILKRDFLPSDLMPLLKQAGIDGCVAVEARQTLQETEQLLTLADSFSIIKGVVGWVDLQAPDVHNQLARFAKHQHFKGVRHHVQNESDDRFMLRPDFLRGLEALRAFNLTYDILVFPRQLPAALEVANRFPSQKFVIDHLAKPEIKNRNLLPWKEQICELAAHENVYCKISGMVVEADWRRWQPSDFQPYLDVVFECFGPDRLMFGSDWPVCLLAAPYPKVLGIVQDYSAKVSPEVQAKLFGENAAKFYGLTV